MTSSHRVVESSRYRLADWLVDESDGTLRRAGARHRLEPRPAQLLALLVRRPGEVVTREELLAGVWGDTHVHEIALARTVSELRKALGDDARDPVYIETVPKRGYRVIAAVEWLDPLLKEKAAVTRPERSRWRTLAAASLTLAALTTLLLHDYRPRDGDEPATLEVGGGEGSVLFERADEYYERQRSRDNENALRLFREALAVNPELVRARAGLAGAVAQKARYEGYRPELIEEAVQLGRAAVAQAPDSPDARWALGLAYSTRGWLRSAQNAYRTALGLDPRHARARTNLAAVLWQRGHRVEALEQMTLLLRDGGTTATGLANLASMLSELGLDTDAEHWFRQALLMEPTRAATVVALAEHEQQRGRFGPARTRLDRLLELDPSCLDCLAARGRLELRSGSPANAAPFVDAWYEAEPDWRPAQLYRVLIARGREPASSRELLERVGADARAYRDSGTESWWAPWSLAAVSSLQRDREGTVAALESAIGRGLLDWRRIMYEPLFEWLRQEPDVRALVRDLRRQEAGERQAVQQRGLLERLPS